MIENNNYGALQNEQEPKATRQRFDISEPNYGNVSNSARSRLCCGHKNDTDGFKVIVTSMFVFAVGVTVALIITIASGKKSVVFSWHNLNSNLIQELKLHCRACSYCPPS